MSPVNPSTGLPGPLDVLLRDLHQLWCQDCITASEEGETSGCEDWALVDADPQRAAVDLSRAIWHLGEQAKADGPYASDYARVLDELSWALEQVQEGDRDDEQDAS